MSFECSFSLPTAKAGALATSQVGSQGSERSHIFGVQQHVGMSKSDWFWGKLWPDISWYLPSASNIFHAHHGWAAEVVPCRSIIPSTALCPTLLVAGEAAVNQTRCSGERGRHRHQAKHLGRSFSRRCPGRRMASTGWGGRKSREAVLSCHGRSSSSGLREDPSTLVDGLSVSCC